MMRHNHTKYDVKSHDPDDDHFYSCDHYEESRHDGKGSWIEDRKDQGWDNGNYKFCFASCRKDVDDAL